MLRGGDPDWSTVLRCEGLNAAYERLGIFTNGMTAGGRSVPYCHLLREGQELSSAMYAFIFGLARSQQSTAYLPNLSPF